MKKNNKCCFKYFDPVFDIDRGCQFEVSENELFEYDGSLYCKFHLPISSDLKRRIRTDPTQDSFLTNEKSEQTEVYNQTFLEDLEKQCDLLRAHLNLEKWTEFQGVVFPGEVSFESETLDGANFRYCEFHGPAMFTGTVFKSSAEFDNAIFYDEANFYNANFSNALQFDQVAFHGDAHFGYAGEKFSLAVAIEEEFADSQETITKEELEQLLDKIEEVPGGYFRNCDFYQRVTFGNRKFTSALDFKGAVFNVAPEFYNCDFHQETYFPSHRHFKDTSSEDAYHRYRVLKLAMENVRNRVDEGGFFTLEQRSLRQTQPWVKNYLSFSFLYDLTSEYGINSSRSLIWLSAISTLFSIIYSILSINPGSPKWLVGIESTITNIVRPFQIWRVSELEPLVLVFGKPNIFFIQLLMTFQSILCLSLIAIFFLSLRWRFKRG